MWGLDGHHDRGSSTPDLAMQQATVNLFSDMGMEPGSLQAGLVPGKGGTPGDTQPPTSTITAPQGGASLTSGTPVTITGTASDAGGGHVASVSVSTDGGATWQTAAGTTSWTYQWTPGTSGPVTLKSRASDDSLNLETPSAGVNVTVTPRVCPCSLWTMSTTPGPVDSEAAALEVGIKFTTDSAGTITRLRFYKYSTNTGTHIANLWTGTGTLLATVPFTNETASGWQEATFTTPVQVSANTTYVASYHTTTGHYAATVSGFATAVDNAPLHAPASGNGVYAPGASSVFPNQTWMSSNYWVDVVFTNGPPPQVAVPNVVSLTQAAATTAIVNAGLVTTVSQATSTTVPVGTVISQNPAAGTQVAGGSNVAIVVSTGVTVPNVVNLTQAAATTALTNASLNVGTVSNASSATVPAGSVISQSPAANTQASGGTNVNLVVSTGATVPNVVNLTQAAATTAITNAGLVASASQAASTTVPIGTVISQSPPAGMLVTAGSTVTIVVSTGVTVPGVLNLTQADATTALTNASLNVGTVSTASSATVPVGLVISQTPAAGMQASGGTNVNLVVSLGLVVPNVVNLTQAAATTAITNVGLVASASQASSTTVPIGSVISQSPAAGTSVTGGSTVTIVVSTGVTVPNVVGLAQAAATTAITNASLKLGTVTTASSTTVLAGNVISQTPAANTQASAGTNVNLVVSTGPPPVGISVDGQAVFSEGAGARTTPAFNTSAAGEVLIAFAASDGPSTGAQTLTVSGAGLTWTLVQRSNTRAGTSEIWKATAAAVLTNATVTSTQTQAGSYRQSLTVVAFIGASGTGASAAANGASGAPSVTLTTTKAGAVVYGVGNDWDNATARTLGANQTLVHQFVDTTSGDTYWVQARTGAIAAANTSVQLNDTAPTNDRWNFASVEVIP
jgi:beta-lactam-binding protein with PASTA domain